MSQQVAFLPGQRLGLPRVASSTVFRPKRLYCTVAQGSAPNWNPQNVANPQVLPSPSLLPEQCVQAQLDALLENNTPWPNHGLQTMYEFGEDIGGLDPSFYFGFRKDLYHFDHFMGQFQSKLPHLMDLQSYSIAAVEEKGEQVEVAVDVTTHKGVTATYKFVLKVKDVGRKKGSWMTKSLLQVAG